MSGAIAFDTHRFVKRLTRNGFTEAQAEALADEQVALLNGNLATKESLLRLEAITKESLLRLEAATEESLLQLKAATERNILELKRDIEELKGAQKQQLAELEGKLDRELGKVKADILVLKWMVGLVIVAEVLPLLKSLF